MMPETKTNLLYQLGRSQPTSRSDYIDSKMISILSNIPVNGHPDRRKRSLVFPDKPVCLMFVVHVYVHERDERYVAVEGLPIPCFRK